MSIRVEWVNEGVAPPYHVYIPAVNLMPATGGPGHTFELRAVDVRTWLPGAHTMTADLELKDLPAGEYSLRLGLLSPHDGRPVIQLANAGLDAGGWYVLSQVAIVGE